MLIKMIVYFTRSFYLNPTSVETDSLDPYDLKNAIFKKLIERKEADGLLNILEIVEHDDKKGSSPQLPIKVKVCPSHLSVSKWKKIRFEPENIIKRFDPFYVSKQEECEAIYKIWKESVLSTDLLRVGGREGDFFFRCNREANINIAKLKRDIHREVKKLKAPAGIPKIFLRRDKFGRWILKR